MLARQWNRVRAHQLRHLHTVARDFTRNPKLSESVRWLEEWDRGDYRDAYFYLLRRCIATKALLEGRRLHSIIRRRRYDFDGFLGNLLIKLYGACNATTEARQTFDALPTHSSMLALNNMLNAYIQNGELHKAREFFDSCRKKDPESWNTMLTAYAENGDMSKAREFFKTCKSPSDELWATLIKGYARSGRIDRARVVFKAAPKKARLWTAMLAANAENGHISEAREMFDKMSFPSVASCTPLFDHYVAAGNLREARVVFDRMGHLPGAPWTKLLTAYLDRGDFSEAWEVFRSMPEKESHAWNAMIRAASERGDLRQATELFEEMGRERNTSSWNVIMEAYSKNGRPKDVQKIFQGMKQRYVKVDRDTFRILTQACTELEDAEKVVKEIQWSLFIKDSELNNGMVRLLVKLGGVEQAGKLFRSLEVRESETWTLMVRGFADTGQDKLAGELFSKLVAEGVTPDEDVFRSLVSGCKIQNKQEEAGKYFRCMVGDFEVVPTYGLYVCMVELVKKTSECLEFIQSMPYEPDKEVWTFFLELCNKAGDQERVKVAERALSELRLEELGLEEAERSKKSASHRRKSSYSGGEESQRRLARMAEIEQRARTSLREERTKVTERVMCTDDRDKTAERSGMIMDTEVLRAKTMDLEKFWIGE